MTIRFSETVIGFDNSDITLENGTLTAVSSMDGGVNWTAIFTPTDDIEDATNVISVGTGMTDLAGNAPLTGRSSNNFTIDTASPEVVSIVMDDTNLKIGETANVTITFNEPVFNFSNSDVNVENGTLSALTTSDGGVTWTGTYTPHDDVEDTTNVITVGTVLNDESGNTPITSAVSGNYIVDTKEPVVTSVVLSDSDLTAGETPTLTITFSEAVTDSITAISHWKTARNCR